jgi:hypothetical protein
MNIDETVKELRWLSENDEWVFAAETMAKAAALIESLQAKLDERNKECETQYELLAEKNQQLAASKRRERAAREALRDMVAQHYTDSDEIDQQTEWLIGMYKRGDAEEGDAK